MSEDFLKLVVEMNNKGSTLVLLIIIVSIVIVLGAALLNIVLTNYEIKRFNSVDKQAFYLSEDGLNASYVLARNLIDIAIINSVITAEEYLVENSLNEEGAKNIFESNYKQYITVNIKRKIKDDIPSVEVTNSSFVFDGFNKLKVSLRSSYVLNGIERLTMADLIIGVPEIDDVIDGVYDLKNYIDFANWNI